MGVANPNIEPGPYNLEKMHKFYRSTNDVIRPLCYLHWFQIQKNLPEDSIPGVQCSLLYITQAKKPKAQVEFYPSLARESTLPPLTT